MEVHLRRLGPNSKTRNLNPPADGSPKVWLAGRGTCCHIYTKSKYASRKHFSITFRDRKYFIADLQSANGTFVDDEKLTSEKVLEFGNIISVGVPANMQNTPDCIVYVFELLSEKDSAAIENMVRPQEEEDDDICIIDEHENSHPVKPNSSTINSNLPLQNDSNMDVDKPEWNDEDCKNIFNNSNAEVRKSDETLIKTPLGKVVMPELQNENLKRVRDPTSTIIGETPGKIRKLLSSNLKQEEKSVEESKSDERSEIPLKNEMKELENKIDNNNEDLEIYEALTQVDESQIKEESNLLNYSQSEELIEISDSDEEDWSMKSIKTIKGDNDFGEVEEYEEEVEEEDDDDVIFIETITKSSNSMGDIFLQNKMPTIEDDLTETDKKWMDKLFKIKQEDVDENLVTGKMESVKISEDEIVEETTDGGPTATEVPVVVEDILKEQVPSTSLEKSFVSSEVVKSSEIPDEVSKLQSVEVLPEVEVPKAAKKLSAKKSVSFDLVPKIRYIEASDRMKFSALEKGKMQFTKIIYNICKWNTVWLEECKRMAPDKVPPDICDEPLRKIPRKFQSHSDYMSAFLPAMILDLWNKIKVNWKRNEDSAFRQTLSCDFCEDFEAENLTVYKCTGLVQSVEAHKMLLKEGHLVMLRLHQIHDAKFNPASNKYSKKLGYLVFGFVERKAYERIHDQPIHKALAERCLSSHGDLHLVRLSILVKKRPNLKIDQRKLIQITVVDKISFDIRKFKAVCFLPQSPLCKAILRPAKAEFSLSPATEKKETVFKGFLDSQQKEIVLNLTQSFASTESFLYSIHGAAGTGKGQLIVAFILQLLYGGEFQKSEKPKILYCTNSIRPLDEMVDKLKKCREKLGELLKFNVVRVGPTKDAKPEIKDLCLSNLAQNVTVNKNSTDRRADPEIQILKRSDVICTTCSSSGTYKLVWALEESFRMSHRKNQKLICILDEAMQISESTALLPLLLGVTHLLLVGDRFQFEPPFSGEKTHMLGLDTSLFWRIYKNYTNIPNDLWALSELRTQYRMNPSLSKFTGKNIYNCLMEDSVQNMSHKISNLQSYLFLMDEIHEDLSEEAKEQRGVCILLQLVNAIVSIIKTTGKAFFISIITCDSKQNNLFLSLMPKKDFPLVEINEVKKFQGRETDVVIFPYNGSRISMPEIAVAMTRARSSLIILTTQLSIANHLWFQKVCKEAEEEKILKHIHSNITAETFELLIKST